METISNTTHKARKEHTCNYCHQKIKIGQIYHRQFNKYDEVYTWKSHDYCSKIASELKMFDDCDEGVTHEDFVEHIKEAMMLVPHNLTVPPEFSEMLKIVIEHRLNIKI